LAALAERAHFFRAAPGTRGDWLPPTCLEEAVALMLSLGSHFGPAGKRRNSAAGSRMWLVQILLPAFGKEGRAIARHIFRETALQLARDFGGVTAYTRAPAEGLWRNKGQKLEHDDIVIYEVMAKSVNPRKWALRKKQLATTFRQDEIIVRSVPFRPL
jgi:hypothetical protein